MVPSALRHPKHRLSITSARVCSQDLLLPDNVHVVSADSAAADLASSAMFALSKVPYLFSTACSDGVIRFWACQQAENEETFEFAEWKLNSTIRHATSQVKIDSYPLAISCSYNSRFAVAYKKKDAVPSSSAAPPPHTTFANYCVDIYECESTGGSEWKLEDCLCLKNIVLPALDSGINFDYIFGNHKPIRPARSCHSFKSIVFTSATASGNSSGAGSAGDTDEISANDAVQVPEIPSTAAKISIKRKYAFEKTGKI